MLCQHCNQNEANIRFQYMVNGQSGEVHLCSECAQKLQSQAGMFTQTIGAFTPMLGLEGVGNLMDWGNLAARPQPAAAQESGAEIDADIRRRRKVNELRARLDSAVGREDYEEAARLRDEILKTEKGVCAHES